MVTTKPTLTQLEIEKIETNSGYTIIQQEQISIPKTFRYSLHIINLDQINDSITEIYNNVKLLPNNIQYTLLRDITTVQNKLSTLTYNHHLIKKRGLFNFIGTINKWMIGTMDDEDRQWIDKHLESIDSNNHELITNTNRQVRINENFNTSINKLYDTIIEDRKIIQDFITNETTKNELKILTFDIKLNIQMIDKLISDLQDNVIFSKLNIIHPSLLTHEEIVNYTINPDKIKNLRVRFTKTTTNKLIFLVKIPDKMKLVNKKVIIPLANTDTCNSINSELTETLEYNKQYYEYNENKAIHELKELKHCVISKDCINIKNCKTEIYNIDDSSIIIQLANNTILTSNRDERNYTLNGNYFIKFYNCTINLNDKIFYNDINEIKHNFILPNLNYNPIIKPLSFEDIVIKTTKNIEEIKELKFHKTIVYTGIGTISFITIILITVLIIYLYCKNKNEKIKINISSEKLKNKEYHFNVEELKKKI